MRTTKLVSLALLAATALPGATALAQNACPAINVPSSFTSSEKFFAWGTDMDLKSGDSKFGKIVERTLHLTTTFEIQDAGGAVVGTAHEKLFSWGTQIEVRDCAGQKIGTVKEEILKSFFHTYTSYKILDAQDRQIASSEKLELLATNFNLRTNDGREVGTMHRPWLNLLTDKWNVTYNSSSGIDPRLWLTIPAYKTAADKARRAEEDRRRNDDSKSSMNESGHDSDSRDAKAIAMRDEAPSSDRTSASSERRL